MSVVQGQNDWGVTYTPTKICALKGSTVDISCTYRYPSWINYVEKTFWYTKKIINKEPVDLKTDSEYRGRVQYHCNKNDCTLRITDLRESDSAVYKFRFITNQDRGRYTGEPGVTLTVAVDPGVQVQVRPSSPTRTKLTCHSNCRLRVQPSYIWYKNGTPTEERTAYFYPDQINPDDYYSCALSGYDSSRSPSVYAPKLPSVSVSPSAEIVEGSSVTLTCSSDANPAANYTWYKSTVSKVMTQGRQLVFSSIQSYDSGEYNCTAENQLGKRTSEYIIDVKYAPKLPSVSASTSAEIVEGSSVTLTCSSDANPAASYTWYKENQILQQGPEGIYYFTSISYKDRGFYHCKSKNDYGQINSSSHFIDVRYAPKLPSVSVSPSAEIVEGSSVTLSCSSDANPAASYTWYKENQKLPSGPGGKYNLFSVSSKDSGIYYCKSENQYGQINSTSLFIDVWYAPKLPSVSVSPSAEIVEGTSVNLTCSSDANPAANYTWYKENEDSPKASGQIFTITDVRLEHSGNYYCEAQNKRGRQYSTLHLAVAAVNLMYNVPMSQTNKGI
ncbi:myelin-associated glycoprotein-like [Scomber scombrus]|uniref:myelin-associated glycoprotein-like n=1 Tax=Scomber scombrus TaxID=13677 RepID=UPI002DDBD556|nr:myelin-associated glycoprotein-like [Scomber scombrus]